MKVGGDPTGGDRGIPRNLPYTRRAGKNLLRMDKNMKPQNYVYYTNYTKRTPNTLPCHWVSKVAAAAPDHPSGEERAMG